MSLPPKPVGESRGGGRIAATGTLPTVGLRGSHTGRAAAGTAALLVLGAACGGASQRVDDDSPAKTRIAVVVEATEGVETARVETRVQFSAGEGEPMDDILVQGVVDFERDRGMATQTVAGNDNLSPSETRWFGARMFMQADGAGLPSFFGVRDRPWTLIDYGTLSEADPCTYGFSFGNPLNVFTLGAGGAGSRPDALLDDIRELGGTLDEQDWEDVRGVATTRWRVDLSKVEVAIPEGCDEVEYDVEGPDNMPAYEIWTDSQGRVRRIRLDMSAAADDGAPAIMTTELYDFGVEVDVEEPPAAEVFDMTERMVEMFRGPGTVAADAWEAIAQSDAPGEWTLWFATSDTDVRCYDLESRERDMPWPDEAFPDDMVDDDVPMHNGRPAHCLYGGFSPTVVFVDESELGTSQIVGAVTSSIDSVELRFLDGTTETLTAESRTGLFRSPSPGRELASVVASGPGEVRSECSMNFELEGDASDAVLPCLTLGGIPGLPIIDFGSSEGEGAATIELP
jgi:hypothetical protein